MQHKNKWKLSRRLLSHSLLGATTALTCVALHADTAKNTNDKDVSFLKEAAQGGKMEVEMGRLGSQKGQSTEVKQFADRLVNDHTKANDELMQLAQKKGISLDTSTSADHKEMKADQFSSKSGADFDKAFTKHMIKDHKKDIAKFEKEAAETSDPDVKAFVNKCLPTLREHLQTAQSIGRTLGLDDKSITLNEDNYSVQPTTPVQGAVNVQAETQTAPNNSSLNTAVNSTPPRANIDINTDSTRSDQATTYSSSSADNSINTSASTEPSKPHRRFFSTDKNDGKLLGIIPWHKRHSTDSDMNAVGAPPNGTSETSTEHHLLAHRLSYSEVPKPVQDTITAQGGTTDLKGIKRETENGKTVYRVEFKRSSDKEKVKLLVNEDGTIEKNNSSNR